MRLLTLRLTCVAFLAFSSAHAATFPSAFEPLRMSVDEGLVFSGSGGIFIVYGSPDLVSMPFTSDTITNVGGSYIPGLNQISAIGDFNGDGIDDLLLGSPGGYFYEIVTIDANGCRSAPASAEALAYSAHTLELFWTRVEGNATPVERYDVYRNGELIDTVSSISYMDYDLEPDTEYAYTVSSVSAGGARSEAFASTTVKVPLR